VQINLQSDYTAFILTGIKAFCAKMIKESLRYRELECFASPVTFGWCYLRGSVPTAAIYPSYLWKVKQIFAMYNLGSLDVWGSGSEPRRSVANPAVPGTAAQSQIYNYPSSCSRLASYNKTTLHTAET